MKKTTMKRAGPLIRLPRRRVRGWNLRTYECAACDGRGWVAEKGIGVPCTFCNGARRLSIGVLADLTGLAPWDLRHIKNAHARVDPKVARRVLDALWTHGAIP